MCADIDPIDQLRCFAIHFQTYHRKLSDEMKEHARKMIDKATSSESDEGDRILALHTLADILYFPQYFKPKA